MLSKGVILVTIELGVILSIISVFLGILGYQLNRTNQQIKKQQIAKTEENMKVMAAKEDTYQDAKLEAQLNYISRGVDDIRIDLKANEKRINEMNEKIARIDESSKQAHKRIDKLEGGVIRG